MASRRLEDVRARIRHQLSGIGSAGAIAVITTVGPVTGQAAPAGSELEARSELLSERIERARLLGEQGRTIRPPLQIVQFKNFDNNWTPKDTRPSTPPGK